MADWVVVVDDDSMNVQMASLILSRNDLRATPLKSGKELIKLVSEGNRPDLILLDIMMPEMDGFQTIERLRVVEKEQGFSEIPVIFLTANDAGKAEMKGLALGAMDFIRKPFIPEVLVMRVKHIIELKALQMDLASEVEKKTAEVKQLSIQVVQAMADAIDAKDTYTNGHSRRVAEYAWAMAERLGYDDKAQKSIYMMGLLHDVGKIGVPDAVINKPARLTDEEYEIIKTHPVIGARILEKIKAMPTLMTGAKWHHERYDGTGYPDGLKGNEIPEEARIIAVADAYDAMSSRRSYRDELSQATVRAEIEKGKGTQFDPAFADIMLQMIDEDVNYDMREHVL